MKKLLVIVIVLAVMLMAADKPKVAELNIKNRSDAPAVFYFFPVEGGVVDLNPALIVSLEPKTNKLYSLVSGDYQVEVYACGSIEIYTTTIRGHFNLTIPACPRWTHVPVQHDGALKAIPE